MFSINASINDTNCNPIGYYIKDFKEASPVNIKNGNGNFYLKPNGALLIIDTSAVICEASKIQNYSGIRLGIQSGPMLLLNGVINANFNANSTNKNIRCGVGVFTNNKKESFLIFCTSVNPISFYTFSLFFSKKFNCSNALCLESVNCAMNLPYLNSNSSNSANVICNYIVYPIY